MHVISNHLANTASLGGAALPAEHLLRARVRFARAGIALGLSAALACAGAASSRAQTLGGDKPPGSLYTLTSKTSGLELDNEGLTGIGGVWQWIASPGNSNQQWKMIENTAGYYTLVSVTSGLALSQAGADQDGSRTSQQALSMTDPRQQWRLESEGGYYKLINAASGKALDNSGSHANAGNVWEWDSISGNPNQLWQVKPVQLGAKTPFTTFEAEEGTLGGGAQVATLAPAVLNSNASSAALEASGHSYVHLAAAGQSVSIVNATHRAMTAINIRYSIPDAPQGGGIRAAINLYVNGVFRQSLGVNSKQTWMYENGINDNGRSKDPTQGTPHLFWDEVHALVVGGPIAPDSTVTLKMDAANTAPYYDIDLIELEAPPAPLSQPANTLSIVSDCGAVANNSHFDSTGAIQQCFDLAQSTHKIVWIPEGTYYLNSGAGLNASGIDIEGAGMWYSIIYYNVPVPAAFTSTVFSPYSTTMRNFAIDADAIGLGSPAGETTGINVKGPNWVIDSLWLQHVGPSIWADGSDGIVENCRINNSWADGINLNNGNGGDPGAQGQNLTALNNHIRGTGDDGLAINEGYNTDQPDNGQMHNIRLLNNTAVAPWWANNIGIYGSSDGLVANNLATDSVSEYGISIGAYGGYGGPLDSIVVSGNTVIRGGGLQHWPAIGVGVTGGNPQPVANITLRGNTVISSLFDGVDIGWTATGSLLQNNTVINPRLYGFFVQGSAKGNARLLYNTVQGAAANEAAYYNESNPSSFTDSGTGNSGFTVP